MWKWLGMGESSTNGSAESKSQDLGSSHKDDSETEKEADKENQGSDKENQQSQRDEDTEDESQFNARDVATNVGNFLYGFASAATKTAVKLKGSVDDSLDKTILGDFQRENEKFVREKHTKRKEEPVPPWVGYHEEQHMKTQILALSTDERNFVRDPPNGIDFHFDLDVMMPVAIATLKEDRNLTDMRFQLVPKRVPESKFWRNYFYRVSLIKQSSQLLTLTQSESKRSSSGSSSYDKIEDDDTGTTNKSDSQEKPNDTPSDTSTEIITKPQDDSGSSQEGVMSSKDHQADLPTNDVADWEKELQDELQDFEFVSEDQQGNQEHDPIWEKEIEDMLGISGDEESQEKS